MELIGSIVAILPKRSGDSERNGHWEVQQYVMKYFPPDNPRDQIGKHLKFSVFGTDNIAKYNIQLYKEYKVKFDIDARQNPKNAEQWFEDNRAYFVEATNKEGENGQQQAVVQNPSSLI